MSAPVAQRSAPSHPRVILVMIAICVLPLLFATALYESGWRPAHAVNHGTLVQPARALPNVPFRTLDGSPVTFRAWRERWLLVYFAPPGCQSACFDVLRDIRRLRLALGTDAKRLQGVFILPDEIVAQVPSQRDEGVLIVTAAPAVRAQLAATFSDGHAATPGRRYIYLVDPLGNLIMSYRMDVAPTGIIQDLKRLLTYSWVG